MLLKGWDRPVLERSQAVLRVSRHHIVALGAAFRTAATSISGPLLILDREGEFPEPWLGDPVSATVTRVYDARVVRGRNATLARFLRYRVELVEVVDSPQGMEVADRSTEDEAAALAGRPA